MTEFKRVSDERKTVPTPRGQYAKDNGGLENPPSIKYDNGSGSGMGWKEIKIPLLDTKYFETLNGLWTGKKEPFVETGVIRNTNFTSSGVIDYSNVAHLQVEEKQLAKRRLKAGDIILERSGGGPKQPVGRVVFFDKNAGNYSFSNFTTAIRVKDTDTFDPKFIFYALMELYQSGKTEDIQGRTTGIRNLDFSAYKERASFPKIPLSEQKKIADILSTVQRAIEAQERIIQTTTELKKALMHKLFTEGLRNEPQKQTEIGLVPESWEVKDFISLAFLQRGFDITKNNQRHGIYPVVSSGGVSSYHDEAKVKGPGVVIGRKGSLGTVHYISSDYWPHDTTLWIKDFKGNNPRFVAYLLELMRLKRFDTGAANPTLNRNIVHSEKIAIPPIDQQTEIANSLEATEKKISINKNRKYLFQDLFRTLLHELMTAKLRVHELEIIV